MSEWEKANIAESRDKKGPKQQQTTTNRLGKRKLDKKMHERKKFSILISRLSHYFNFS